MFVRGGEKEDDGENDGDASGLAAKGAPTREEKKRKKWLQHVI